MNSGTIDLKMIVVFAVVFVVVLKLADFIIGAAKNYYVDCIIKLELSGVPTGLNAALGPKVAAAASTVWYVLKLAFVLFLILCFVVDSYKTVFHSNF